MSVFQWVVIILLRFAFFGLGYWTTRVTWDAGAAVSAGVGVVLALSLSWEERR